MTTLTPAVADGGLPPHAAFLALVPHVEAHARRRFRRVACPHRRADLVAEAVALAWRWFVRLRQRGRDAAAFPGSFGALAARAAGAGRRLAGQAKATDALSMRVSSGTEFTEWLTENARAPVPDQVAFRLDWPAYLATLTDRDRRLAAYLALGHTGKEAAAAFGVTPPRVTQLRQRLRRGWRQFQAAGRAPSRTEEVP